jgi:hypothetical protein
MGKKMRAAEIVQALETEEEGSEELDTAIAEYLGHKIIRGTPGDIRNASGRAIIQWQPPHFLAGTKEPCPKFSRSLDMAYSLIPNTGPFGQWRTITQNRGYIDGVYQNGNAVVVIHHPLSSGGGPRYMGNARTLSTAVCAAAIRAIEAQNGNHL